MLKRLAYLIRLTFALTVFVSSRLLAQLPVTIKDFKNDLVIYSDLGTTTAPFRIKLEQNNKTIQFKYKHNYRMNLGFGFAYRWASLRFSFPLPGYMRPLDAFGESKIFNIGSDFKLKRFFIDLDIRHIRGYGVRDMQLVDAPLSRNDIGVLCLSAQGWYFHNAQFNVTAFKGKTAHFDRRILTFYGKSGFGINRLGSNDVIGILPPIAQDSAINIFGSHHFTSVDLYVVPGIAFVDRRHNFQYGLIAGLGFSIQQKGYFNGYENRYFLGLAPKYDLSFVAGFNSEHSFLMLTNELDSRIIHFKELKYDQFIHSIRLTGGIRIKQLKKDRKIKHNPQFNKES
jgi:hypothetical protein